jgi:C1A family cysteine protease
MPSKPKPLKIKHYGWRPDLPDQRDYVFELLGVVHLAPAVDLRPHCPPVLNQGQLGSCTANAIASVYEFDQMKQKVAAPYVPSRLFIYYNERVLENTVSTDSGATIRDSVKSVTKWGAPPETLWPYKIGKFAVKPSANSYKVGKAHQAVQYQRVSQTLQGIKTALAGGFPVAYGFSVYESFESAQVAKTGVVPMPAASEKLLGGHANMLVGYNDATSRFLSQNSWGTAWGMAGYFTIPYDYLTNPNLSSDFWVVRGVEG